MSSHGELAAAEQRVSSAPHLLRTQLFCGQAARQPPLMLTWLKSGCARTPGRLRQSKQLQAKPCTGPPHTNATLLHLMYISKTSHWQSKRCQLSC